MYPAPDFTLPYNLLTMLFHSLSPRVGASFAQATPQRALEMPSDEQETQGATDSQVARSLHGSPDLALPASPAEAPPNNSLSGIMAPASPVSTVPSSASKLQDDVI